MNTEGYEELHHPTLRFLFASWLEQVVLFRLTLVKCSQLLCFGSADLHQLGDDSDLPISVRRKRAVKLIAESC